MAGNVDPEEQLANATWVAEQAELRKSREIKSDESKIFELG
jgi:hypothetical protein